jgi:hypothetical protein
MFEFYEKLKESLDKNQTQFKNFIEEVCELKPKSLKMNENVQNVPQIQVQSSIRKGSFEGKKERSMTNGSSDFSKSSHYSSSNNTNNGHPTQNQHKNHEKIFIPRNNPLAEMNLNK